MGNGNQSNKPAQEKQYKSKQFSLHGTHKGTLEQWMVVDET